MSEPLRRPAGTEDREHITINMGPSHPSTHGVLRLVLELDGEIVLSCKPDIGYLHRGFEKIAENKTWQQFVTWTDRMDYLAPISNNIGYVLAVCCDRRVGVNDGRTLIRVDDLADRIPTAEWHMHSCGPGAKGPRDYPLGI